MAIEGIVYFPPRTFRKHLIAARYDGFFAGSQPDGVTRVEGVPTSAQVRVFLRTGFGKKGDGLLVGSATSNVSGQWKVSGLNPLLKYDVICQYIGYNDLIWSAVSPKVE